MTSRENASNENRVSGALLPVENSEDEISQPRQPRDLQGLLRFAVEAGNSGQPDTSNFRPLDPGRRQFLEEALSSMTVNIAEELNEALNKLRSLKHVLNAPEGLRDTSPYLNALETIMDHVDNIDIANDFCKMNGFEVLNECMSCGEHEVRWRAAEVVAVCTQNNPFSQQYAVGMLPTLMKMAEHDTSEECRVKAFYAVSCIVRDSPEMLKEFMALDGFSFLLREMQSGTLKLQIKASFLLSTLLSQKPMIKDDLCNMGFVEQLVGLIQRDHSEAHEHMISALLLLVTDHEPAIFECRRSELRLHSCLLKLVDEYAHEDAFREEVSYIRQILQIVFSGLTDVER